ncbi:MAG: DUF1844 domain-containing protein [Verrucomicrobiales bacterium]|nr:DUF1844 domain-containing protein [Verrucomicrobiales bacterium]
MSPSPSQPASGSLPSAAARHTALFTGMVLQQANMALMFLGKAPRPDTDQPTIDLEAASQFIDTLEMFEAKTQGNLNAAEAGLLRETLMTLRITFVEVAETKPGPTTAPTDGRAPTPDAPPAPDRSPPAPGAAADAPAEDRKKFVKRY